MSETTQTSAAQRGAFYLLTLGVVGVLMGAYFVCAGFTEIWASHSLDGIGSLVSGAFLGAAAVVVLMLGREARNATKRPLAGR